MNLAPIARSSCLILSAGREGCRCPTCCRELCPDCDTRRMIFCGAHQQPRPAKEG